MPLLDHFHPPLYPARSWESFHGRWAAAISDRLNAQLPERYYAEMQMHLGTQVEIDVATLEESAPRSSASGNGNGNVAVADPVWAPPAAAVTVPLVFPESVEILVLGSPHGGDRVLVAAIELVSPSNKDRPETRQAFAIKCAAYLQAGCGLVIVDVVSNYTACLHNDLVALLDVPQARLDPAPRLSTTAYHPHRRDQSDLVAIWREALALNHPLPTMPLFVRGLGPLPVDLEATYHEACARNKLVPPGPSAGGGP